MDKQQLLEYRQGWKAVEKIELKEQRTASMALRWQQLNSILRLARGLNLPLIDKEREKEVEVVRQRWMKLKGALLAKSRGVA